MRTLELVVPGDLQTPTGGYIYDRRVIDGLRELGWRATVHGLDASFPHPTPAALRDARGVLGAIAPGSLVVIDGLALPGLERLLEAQAQRLTLVALVHHPVSLETGVGEDAARLLAQAERNALALMQRVIVTSQWTARALGDFQVPIARVRVVEPGTDRAPAHGSARAPNDTLSLLCVATLTARKGHAVLIDALAEVRDRHWHLTCAGSLTRDPDTVAELSRKIEHLRLGNRISLLGDLDAATLERYYERADLFVLASYLEGYGMALAEAVARGIPVVSTTAGAIPETVPADASILVPPGDSRALAKALATLLDAPQERAKLARAALAARERLPSWSDAAAKFALALDGLGGHAA